MVFQTSLFRSVISLQASWKSDKHLPAVDWPHAGAVELNHYSCRYRDGLDLVLSDVSCHINAGEKVNVCESAALNVEELSWPSFKDLT